WVEVDAIAAALAREAADAALLGEPIVVSRFVTVAVVVTRLLAMAAVVAPCPVAVTIIRGSGRGGEHGQRGRCCDETCDFPSAFHVFSPRELSQRRGTIAIGPPTFVSSRPIQRNRSSFVLSVAVQKSKRREEDTMKKIISAVAVVALSGAIAFGAIDEGAGKGWG